MANDPKQVIVVRTKYPDGKGGTFKCRMGKLIAQAAHGSLKVILDMAKWSEYERSKGDLQPELTINPEPAVAEWLTSRFAKIVCYVESEEELDSLYAAAKDAGLPCALITDAGLTEFKSPQKTAVAIGPSYPADIDPITKDLKLL